MSSEAPGWSSLSGALQENLVFTELTRWLSLFRPEWTTWFYRDHEQREAEFLLQRPSDRRRILDVKWAETPPMKAFASCEGMEAILARAEDVTETEVALIARRQTNHQFGERRKLISAFEIARFLAE